MEQRLLAKSAVMRDAPTKCGREEYVEGMEQRLQNYAVKKDAPTLSRREEFVRNTGQRGRLAVMMDTPAKL